jgi:tetratricopeptide (TPR) repeat protein
MNAPPSLPGISSGYGLDHVFRANVCLSTEFSIRFAAQFVRKKIRNMKLSLKMVSIIVMIQIVTGLIVFALTRAYYQNETPVARGKPSHPAIGQPDSFTQDLINSLKNHPQFNLSNDPVEIDQQANQAFQSGDYARAATLYKRVISLAPNNAEPHNNLGLTLHYLGRSAEALEILKRGTELQPEFQRIWLTLGFVQSGVANAQDAKVAFRRAIELGPETGPGKSASEMLQKLP